ncbi:MAG: hypothetical protein MUE60_04450 [Candidatus Eisenbacteria bacterium]|jgi:hypothetical protein|nr:hypothetical protein [Candidatus Eisenbacteria bacterium]
MMSRHVDTEARGAPRLVMTGVGVLVLISLMFGTPDSALGDRFAGAIHAGVTRIGHTVSARCESIRHAYAVAAGSLTLLARIARDITATPIASPSARGLTPPPSRPGALPAVGVPLPHCPRSNPSPVFV